MGKPIVRQKLASGRGNSENDDAKEQQLHRKLFAKYPVDPREMAICTGQQLPISTKTVIEWMCSIQDSDSKGSYNGVAGRSPASIIVLAQ